MCKRLVVQVQRHELRSPEPTQKLDMAARSSVLPAFCGKVGGSNGRLPGNRRASYTRVSKGSKTLSHTGQRVCAVAGGQPPHSGGALGFNCCEETS